MLVNQSGLHNIPSRKVIDHYSAGSELEVLYMTPWQDMQCMDIAVLDNAVVYFKQPVFCTYYHSV